MRYNAYKCSECGRIINANENLRVEKCCFCSSELNYIGEGDILRERAMIIPFQVNREMAEKKFNHYITKNKWYPEWFKKECENSPMVGVYLPVWLYSAKVDVFYSEYIYLSKRNSETTDYYMDYAEAQGSIYYKYHIPYANDGRKKYKFSYEELVPYGERYFQDEYMYMDNFYNPDNYLESVCDNLVNDAKAIAHAECSSSSTRISASVDKFEEKCDDITVDDYQLNKAFVPVWYKAIRGKNGEEYFYTINGVTGNEIYNAPEASKSASSKGAKKSGFIAFALIFIIGVWRDLNGSMEISLNYLIFAAICSFIFGVIRKWVKEDDHTGANQVPEETGKIKYDTIRNLEINNSRI